MIEKLEAEVDSRTKQHDFSSLNFADPFVESPDPDPETDEALNKSVKLEDDIPYG